MAILVMCALVATGCGASDDASPSSSGGAAQSEGRSGPIRIGAIPFAQYSPTYYAAEVADKFGVEIEIKPFPRAVDAVEALKAGLVDVTFGGVGSFFPPYSQGVPMYIVGTFGAGGYRVLARKGVEVNSYADVKGKKVGLTRGALEVIWDAVLDKAGLTRDDVEFVILPGTADMNQVLSRGDVDVIIQSEPPATDAIEAGYATEVSKPYDTKLGQISKVVMMRKELYDDTERAQGFINALVYATKYLQANPDVQERVTREDVFGGNLTESQYKNAIGNAPIGLEGLTLEQVQATADLMRASEQLREDVDAGDALRLDLFEKAVAEVELEEGEQ